MSDWESEFDLEDDDTGPTIAPSQYHSHDTEVLLQRLRDMIDHAPNVPLSSTPRISREEALDLLDEAIVRFPDELKAARWLLKERDEFLEKMQHEADEILDQARELGRREVADPVAALLQVAPHGDPLSASARDLNALMRRPGAAQLRWLMRAAQRGSARADVQAAVDTLLTNGWYRAADESDGSEEQTNRYFKD